ncbi:MAG: hypothetical protein QMD07_04985, partial [Thermodesulfovibrionales bacterium]|nr:hypothetical protein [Thermodesulfovibrionales bacterium]
MDDNWKDAAHPYHWKQAEYSDGFIYKNNRAGLLGYKKGFAFCKWKVYTVAFYFIDTHIQPRSATQEEATSSGV